MGETKPSMETYYISRFGETTITEHTWDSDKVFNANGTLIVATSEEKKVTAYSPGEWFTSVGDAQDAILERFQEQIDRSISRARKLSVQKDSFESTLSREN